MFKNVLITGSPGVGKTTVIKTVIPLLNVKAGGFFTEEIRVKGNREGFAVETLDGQKGVLSHINFKSPYNVGKYGVDVQSFEQIAIPAIESAIKDKELIVIDEIGKMELFSEGFKEAVIKALDSKKPVLGVIKRGSDGFINAIKARNDVKIFTITYENRNTIPAEIAHLFETLPF
ncbi:MAG TPA: NTPase [Candidatus Brocadiia bacterium]|nr:NTPase [Planctomycetota bacterium]MDO8092718.1 NTPase [Candidatus Brocadiales bacterium]